MSLIKGLTFMPRSYRIIKILVFLSDEDKSQGEKTMEGDVNNSLQTASPSITSRSQPTSWTSASTVINLQVAAKQQSAAPAPSQEEKKLKRVNSAPSCLIWSRRGKKEKVRLRFMGSMCIFFTFSFVVPAGALSSPHIIS